MNYTTLNHTDIRVSTIALGCFAFAGGKTWGEQNEQDSLNTLHKALELGINFFDTAEGYGDGYSEQLLGRAFKGMRDDVVIATKVSSDHLRPAELEAACVRSLKRLQTDYIDLYQIHWPNHDVPLAESVGMLEALKDKGMIRAIGVSNFGKQDLADMIALSTPVTNQLPYNLLARMIEADIIPLGATHGVGVLPYSPLMQGLLTGKFTTADEVPAGRARTRHYAGSRPDAVHGEAGAEAQTFDALAKLRDVAGRLGESLTHVSLAWLLQQPAVPAVLVGARNTDQLEDNARAVHVKLSDDVMRELTKITNPLKDTLGTNPDLWQSGEQSRYR